MKYSLATLSCVVIVSVHKERFSLACREEEEGERWGCGGRPCAGVQRCWLRVQQC